MNSIAASPSPGGYGQCCSLKLSFCSLWRAAFWNILVLQDFLGWPPKAKEPYVTGIAVMDELAG